MATRNRRATADAVEILRRRHGDGDREAEALLEEAWAEAELSRTLYRLRTRAKLTQHALARRVGTTASVIGRLEDADHAGHSLPMLRRIAAALGRRVEIRFPVKTAGSTANQTGEEEEGGKPKGVAKLNRTGLPPSAKNDPFGSPGQGY